ncbi:MAG: hypothetical protein ACRD12_00495 [Acidimicrobiales bacterium]
MTYWTNPWNPQPASPPPQQPQRPQPQPPTFPRYDDDEDDERAARRTVWLLGAGVAVLAVGLVVFVTVYTLRSGGGSAESPVITTPEDAARVVGGIGPPPGTEVGAYIDARKAALAGATGDHVAVVSLSAYTTEAKARAHAAPVEVLAVIAAAPGGAPAVVEGDLAGWVQSQTAEARAERDEIQKLIPTVDDGNFKRFYQQEVERLNKLINSIKPNGDLAFAVVVRGPAPALQQLGAKGEVRLVDIGPNAEARPANEYRGLRPEESSNANEPNTRPG